MALVEIKKLSLAFSGLRALADISFDIAEREIVGLIGPNGAGKSTLINCISGLYRPDAGGIYFAGRDLPRCTPHAIAAMGVRRTFQNLQLFQEATVRENVTLGLAYRYQSNVWSELYRRALSTKKTHGGKRRSNQDPCGLRAE